MATRRYPLHRAGRTGVLHREPDPAAREPRTGSGQPAAGLFGTGGGLLRPDVVLPAGPAHAAHLGAVRDGGAEPDPHAGLGPPPDRRQPAGRVARGAEPATVGRV